MNAIDIIQKLLVDKADFLSRLKFWSYESNSLDEISCFIKEKCWRKF